MKKLTKEEFVEKSIIKHGYKYDYSLVNYINNKTKVKIICKEHGEFEQKPEYHLNGNGCPKCSNNVKLTTNEFIEKSTQIHGYRYDYSITKYYGNNKELYIICKEHGVFKQIANNHLNGMNCFKCCGSNKKTTEIFIKESNKIHKNKYDYSLVCYNNNKEKVSIICKEHGIFNQSPISHLRNIGCPKCRTSKGEKLIENYLKSLSINFITQKTFEMCVSIKKLKFDFYLIDYNLCIEYDGKQHYNINDFFGGINEFNKTQKRDEIKNEYCKNNNIRLIRISYKDFNNIEEILKRELEIE